MKKIIYSLRTTFIAALLLFLNVQLIAQTPEITLLYPTESGIELTKGGKYLISWTDNFQSTVDILLSADGGTNYTQLASNISSSTWRWNTGNTPEAVIGGTEYKIRVQSHNSPSIYYDESDHNFSIVDQVNGYITLYQPTGGEEWAEGTKHLISWSDNLNAPVKVELLEDDQNNYTINSSTTANHIKWTVPTNYANVGEKKFRIKISSTVANALTPPAISGKFTITASTGTFIQVLQPNGGEKWKRGTKHMISWTDDFPEDVIIELWKGNDKIKTIASDVSESTYDWTIDPDIDEGTDYNIKVGSKLNYDIMDHSDVFSITKSSGTFVEILQPDGEEKWKRGTTHRISWNDDFTENVRIELWNYNSNPATHTIIDNDVPGSTYDWTIDPDNFSVGTKYWIKVRSIIDGNIMGHSDNYFSITDFTGTSITVLQPNGGEKWARGTEHMISWTDDFPENVKIELWDYSNDVPMKMDNSTVGLPVDAVSGSTYKWSIPGMNKGDKLVYRIKIMSEDETISDESDDNFEIPPSTGTFVDVLQPDGGEVWVQGNTYLISWFDDIPEDLLICLDEYTDANGSGKITYLIFPEPVSGSTKYWYIDPTYYPPCDYCKVRISNLWTYPYHITGESEDMFSIVAYAKGTNKNADIINRMNAADVSVYPNPANQSITILLENADEESYSVEMYNCIGSLVMKTNIIPGSSNNISTSDLPNGIYFLNVSSGDTRISKKIIVRH